MEYHNESASMIERVEISHLLKQAKAYLSKSQADCVHRQGCLLGSVGSHATCIVWHKMEDDRDHPKGICLECQRVFSFADPDYEYWRSLPSGCRASACGVEMPVTESEEAVTSDRSTYICGLDDSNMVSHFNLHAALVENAITANPAQAAELLVRHDPRIVRLLVPLMQINEAA